MRTLHFALLIAVAIVAGPTLAQSTVKAVQPGLFEVAGPRVNDVIAAGIQTITATPGKGGKSIHVHSQWGDSFFGWPKNVKPVAFTIETGKAGGATISAPGFKEANKADYKAAIDSIIPFAIQYTKASRNWMETGSPAGG